MIVLLFTKTLDSYCLTSSSFIKSRRYLTIFSQTSRSFAFWGEPESPRYFLPLQIKCFSIYCKVTWLVCLTILFQKPLLTMEARNNELYLKAWVALAAGIVLPSEPLITHFYSLHLLLIIFEMYSNQNLLFGDYFGLWSNSGQWISLRMYRFVFCMT